MTGLYRSKICRGEDGGLESPVLSPNGQKFAYVLWVVAQHYAARCVVVDGQDTTMYYDTTQAINVTFSPDNHHFVYTVHRHKKSMVVVDGQEGRVYDDVIGGAFRDIADSTDSTQHALAYVAREGRKFYRLTQLMP